MLRAPTILPRAALGAALVLGVVAAACGGGGDDNESDGSTPLSSRVWTMAEAEELLAAVPIVPADLGNTWTIATDTTQDNAAAAAADPVAGASFARCGRLQSRLVANMPEGVVTRYIHGESVSVFSTFTVYATEAGAIDCATEAAARFAQCGELAKAFRGVFIEPEAVSCAPFDYPQVADGSFAVALSGTYSIAGTIVDLTIRIVAYRQGNVTGVVGVAAAHLRVWLASAQGRFDPSVDELRPLVSKTIDRIIAAR